MNHSSPIQILKALRGAGLRRGSLFGLLLMVALLAFEVFNYSTTDFALTDILGSNLRFLGIRWATILSIAFCAIDFAGVARLFTPEQGRDEPVEVWYLFGAWVLAAAMNATLTWWGVAVAIRGHNALGASIIGRETLLEVVPVFVAVMVWIVRILLIGSFSIAGERLFSMADDRPGRVPVARFTGNASAPFAAPVFRSSPNSMAQNQGQARMVRPEPTYHPAGMTAQGREDEHRTWR